MYILGIETSCDETSASVLKNGKVLSNIIFSQIKLHRVYGGVVPEIAAREHMSKLPLVVQEAIDKAGITFKDLNGIAVTNTPGLAGGLIVGVSYAKALSVALKIKLIGVNHVEAHLLSPFIEYKDFSYPFLGLVISGGHTNVYLAKGFADYKLIGSTRDDAAGEAFDKAAKMLGLPYPGGPEISKAAVSGDASKIIFPQAQMKDKSYDFSFSGIKTAVLYYIQRNKVAIDNGEVTVNDIAAAFQKSIVRSISNKMKRIYEEYRVNTIAISGGVAANNYLKHELEIFAKDHNMKFFVPSMKLCTDNGAMIAYTGWQYLKNGISSDMDLEIQPELPVLNSK
ncbi:MAG: tRNA (adenosine(37)-N6)-threonylcarbamoyltransferase complex transferase subunit TsaD [bacterium]